MTTETYAGASLPLMHGKSTLDVSSFRGAFPAVLLTVDGAVDVHMSITPHTARLLAAELVVAADAAERKASVTNGGLP